MSSLRYSAAEESEDTLNSFTSHTQTRQVPILCQWNTDLTLNKHCLLCSNSNRKNELAEINNGHRVLLLLHGGVGKVLGGLSSYESHHGDEPSTENRVTCFTSIWNNSSRHDFLEFNYFVTDGSFTADNGLL